MSIVPTFSILFMCIGLSAAAVFLSPKLLSHKVYDKCQKLTGLNDFKQMIEKLSQQENIPILAKADAHTAEWNDVNYPKHLKEMQRFMDEVNLHNEVLKHPPPGKGHADEFPETAEGLAHDRAGIFRFTTHRNLLNIMDLKCGKKVCKNVLEDALKCAERVRDTIKKQEMPKGKNEKDDKEIQERWTNLDKAFKDNFQKICGPKGEKMDNQAAEEIRALSH